uniref:Rho GTPase activating protein at 102A, isoform C n=1 Tax=Drosophila melanogaster TaxID=7227 RepID=Q2PDM2_DROME|nr:Rho GTPase activating protein at 102A, isoform C [Drosophila melanogaster]ABC65828.2 Rho GTPase activating protein at 102A, isoform C [Drosophila melanogaster]|eukprot:NP_001033802.2 Rho GTPase activating protein at 102A, isoform C [Drosophila melanogaster]
MEFPKENEESVNCLRSPMAAVKKRSGPLDIALDEANDVSKIWSLPLGNASSMRKPMIFASEHSEGVASPNKVRRRSTKDKEKKRERWLLTRKTWRYMTDAGRKLIPDGYQTGSGNHDLIEDQFQRVCLSEPSFILWSRRTSYPGAFSCSKRRLKPLLRHASASRRKQTVDATKDYHIADRVIELLQTYLKLRDAYKTTTLLGTKTVRPDQTSSPSAQRPNFKNNGDNHQVISSGTSIQTELLSLLKLLSNCPLFTHEGIQLKFGDAPLSILEDKVLLKKIYSALKKQQLHRTLHSKDPYQANFSTSLSCLIKNGKELSRGNTDSNRSNKLLHDNFFCLMKCDTKPIIPSPKTEFFLDLNKVPQNFELKNKLNSNGQSVERIQKTCGTQTNFIQLSELKTLAEQYNLMVTNCDNTLKLLEEPSKQDCSKSSHLIFRRSSLDEDISQSVSDTIKRYLNMARKKSMQDSDSNRFKSINYDKNLRNIKAKGVLNPPGISAGLHKAVQTLNAWPLIALDFIRGNESSLNLKNAHLEWLRLEDERSHMQLERDKNPIELRSKVNPLQIASPANTSSYSKCTSAPTSPTSHSKLEKAIRTSSGLLSSSSQFISNILHGHNNAGNQFNTLTDKLPDCNQSHATASMQKSKSLSNVGQFVAKRMWRSRSKSQNKRSYLKSSIPTLKWYPSEHFLWISESGESFQIVETNLTRLSKIESDIVKNFALEKIQELNIGNIEDLKISPQKRRCVPKKKSLTTSFFDNGKKDDQNPRSVLFGTSLECCLERDSKRNVTMEDRSKYSLLSMFRGSGSTPGSVLKLNDNVRSCESLPSKSLEYGSTELSAYVRGSFSNISKPLASLSQSENEDTELNFVKAYQEHSQLMVPIFVNNCIDYLEDNGLQQVGLFRVSTSKKRVKQLREEFDKDIYFGISVDTCPHDVATLLKEFLRDLPEPLLCNTLYLTFLKTQRIRNRRLQLEAISHLIRLLPIPHRDTLYVLLVFLAKVAAHSDDIWSTEGCCLTLGNKMDSYNLATVFAPNILRSTHLTFSRDKEQENMIDAINVVRFVKQNTYLLFMPLIRPNLPSR